MARLVNRLSARRVATAPEGMHPDGAGLYLRVDSNLNRYWVFRYADRSTGRDRQLGIGPTHTIGLGVAREKARECRQQLLEGMDPLNAKASQRAAGVAKTAIGMTFDQCRSAYLEAHQAGWRSAKHAKQWEATLATYASPVFGHLPVAAIDTGLVLKVLEPMWKAKTETASRVRGRIEAVLAWSTVRGYRSGPNPAQWKNHLDKMLPGRTKVRKVEHFAALQYRDVGAFMATLRIRDTIACRALEFAILTAARSGEVTGATRSEFDLTAMTWTIPGSRMKGGRQHIVPLSSQAAKLVASMPHLGELVFPVSQSRLSAVPHDDFGLEVTVHGFRSTFRDWVAEQTAFPDAVAEAALAHAKGDKVEAAYQRGPMLDKRRRMMDAWANYCGRQAGEVVPLRAAAV